MKDLLDRLAGKFQILDSHQQKKNLLFVSVEKEKLPDLVTYMRDYENYKHLVLLTAVDYIENGKFVLQYLIHNYETGTDVGVKTAIDRENAEMISIHHLWAQAWTYQRELKELFGINFPGSPRVDEPFVLEGWEDLPPMRREFNTKEYSEETYFQREGRVTHDPGEYMKEKLYGEGK